MGEVAKMMSIREFKKDHPIIEVGKPGDSMFLLLSGSIEILKKMVLFSSGEKNVKEKSLIRLKDSSNVFFGEMSMFGDDTRSATVTALTDVTVGVLTRESVDCLCRTDPALGYHLFYNIGQTVAQNLRRANRDILKLTTAFVLALEGK